MNITPFLPNPSKDLEQKILNLIQLDGQLDQLIPKTIRTDLEFFLRFVNSYYSNRIEGNSTKPHEIIELSKNSSENQIQFKHQSTDKREILRHIEVQLRLAKTSFPHHQIATEAFIQDLHHSFYQHCTPDELKVIDHKNNQIHHIEAGKYRTTTVQVGHHIPPHPDQLAAYMHWFCEFYNITDRLGLKKFYAAAASHHRLAWIHPFLDGNGRVIRLFTDCFMQAVGLKSYGIWTMARGFSRQSEQYFQQLALADYPRQGITDGRGILSDRGLASFTAFFFDVAIDQVQFFIDLLEPEKLNHRIDYYFNLRIHNAMPNEEKLAKESLFIYKTLLYEGAKPRIFFQNQLKISERKLRDIVKTMEKEHLIYAPHKADLRVALSHQSIEVLFPKLLH